MLNFWKKKKNLWEGEIQDSILKIEDLKNPINFYYEVRKFQSDKFK